ncbi:MAG: MBL fold metallo-hydrolase, partial [Mycobacterium sp.]|uniref:MBL fold metallo-hydrolase n=1 Tax=Mycobacterium sp. TaxID=1785 RepID=UPI003C490216
MAPVRLGRASLTRVVELRFDLGIRAFPRTPPSGWRDNADLLVPEFFDPDTDQFHIAIQSWVIEVDGLTVVVDTGVGNDRQRPHMPPLDHLSTGFLAALQSSGVDRNAVDVVINTHIHSDHVGWNTMGDNGTWV